MVELHSAAIVRGPVGECIYCGSSGDPSLSREHVIPLSLNGSIILHEASCLTCANETKRDEGLVTGKMLREFRRSQGVRRRNRQKSDLEEKTLPLWVEYEFKCDLVDVPFRLHPGVFPIIIFPDLPSVLTNESRTDISVQVSAAGFHDYAKKHFPGFRGFHGTFVVYFREWAGMLVKIAHSFATMQLGLGGFSPLLPDVIRHISDSPLRFVGHNPFYEGPRSAPVHRLNVRVDDFPNGRFVVAEVELFSNWPASPSYLVAVGRPNGLTQERLERAPFYPAYNGHKRGNGRKMP